MAKLGRHPSPGRFSAVHRPYAEETARHSEAVPGRPQNAADISRTHNKDRKQKPPARFSAMKSHMQWADQSSTDSVHLSPPLLRLFRRVANPDLVEAPCAPSAQRGSARTVNWRQPADIALRQSTIRAAGRLRLQGHRLL